MIDLLIGLSAPATRPAAARGLAARLAVDEVLIFVRDPELGVMLPAAGMPQTMRAGPSWRQFLRRAADEGIHCDEVEFPAGSRRSACACNADRAAVVMLGGEPLPAGLLALQQVLPLLAIMLDNEQRLRLAEVALQQARDQSRRSGVLSQALEAARSEASSLNVQLQEEDRLKDQFLAMLAHELRNPLAGVVASLQMLRRGEVTAPQRQRALELMARQSAQLEKLVDDLMDVARVNHGRIALDPQPLVLQDVLRASVESNRHAIEAKGLALELRLPDEMLVVDADTVRLTQVFSNLLHNATKYTDRGGHIAVAMQRDGDQAVVTIADSGIGIDPNMLDAVFALFNQGPVTLDRSQGGLGLGLKLVRKLLALHGGRVTAHSQGHGLGSTFTVWLPLHAGQLPRADEPQPMPARPLNVLIIEDNPDVAEALCELLSMDGHNAEPASRGQAGLARIARGGIDLVLLDLGLPDMDGYEVVRRIRAAGHRTLRVVALTGYSGPDVSRATREAGFDDHRVKPLIGSDLDEVLAKAAEQPSRDERC